MAEVKDVKKDIDNIIATVKDRIDDGMTVVRGTATKKPSLVRVVDQDALPVDEDTKRRLLKEQSRKEDSLIRTLTGSVSDPQILSVAAGELAEEIHSLKYERERFESEGKDITHISGRRVTALKALIDTALKLKELSKDEPVDFNSIQMQVIMKLIFSKIEETLKKVGYTKQDIQAFFQVFIVNMETFQVEAQRLIDQEIASS